MSTTGKEGFRLALAQMRVEPAAPARNLDRAVACIAGARGRGAHVVLLPEAMDCGWTHPSARELAGPIPGGVACERLRAAARDTGLHVCVGLVERAGARLFNAAILVDPAGQILLHHRKIHEIEFARALYARGDRLGVVDTPLARIGLMICADAFVPGLAIGRALGSMGAEVILSPCAWAVPPEHDPVKTPYGQLWLDSYGPVAREYGLWVAGCSNVGPVTAGEWKDWRCIGCSLVVGPEGSPVLRGAYGVEEEALLLLDIPNAESGARNADLMEDPDAGRGSGRGGQWSNRDNHP